MRTACLIRTTLVCSLPFLFAPGLLAQSGATQSPLDGTNFISVHGSVAGTLGVLDDGLIPGVNSSFDMGAPTGNGFEIGISMSRLMPILFLSTSTTAEARFFYSRNVSSTSGFGNVEGSAGNDKGYLVSQVTSATTTIAGLQGRLIFDTQKMQQVTPVVQIGLTLGHILDIHYETEYKPAGAVNIPDNGNGLPAGTAAPDRRWFYAAAHIGGGGRFSLGDPATSPAIVPEVELIIPVTSYARSAQWIMFGVRAGIGLRWPL